MGKRFDWLIAENHHNQVIVSQVDFESFFARALGVNIADLPKAAFNCECSMALIL